MRVVSLKWVVALVALSVMAAAGLRSGSPPQVVANQEIKEVLVDPTQDTYLATAIEVPAGEYTSLRAGWRLGAEYETLIQFDFADDIGDGADIVEAVLELYCIESEHEYDQTTTVDLQLSIITTAWDENRVTVKRPPRYAGPKIRWSVERCDESPGWRTTADITDQVTRVVRDWYSGRLPNVYGWHLAAISDEPESVFTFHSMNEEPPSPLGLRPHLRIRWRGGTTPTLTPSNTPTATSTFTPTATFTPSMTPTVTNTPTITPTPKDTPTPTATNTPEIPEGAFMPLVLKLFTFPEEPAPQTPPTPEVPSETPPPLAP